MDSDSDAERAVAAESQDGGGIQAPGQTGWTITGPLTLDQQGSPPPDAPFVFLFEDIRRVEVEGGRGARIGAAEFGVTTITDGDVLQASVHHEIDERRASEDGVRDQIAAEPVEHGADDRARDARPSFGSKSLRV